MIAEVVNVSVIVQFCLCQSKRSCVVYLAHGNAVVLLDPWLSNNSNWIVNWQSPSLHSTSLPSFAANRLPFPKPLGDPSRLSIDDAPLPLAVRH